MEPPEVGLIPRDGTGGERMDRATDDQRLMRLVITYDNPPDHLEDVSPVVVDYALQVVANLRRSLQRLKPPDATCAVCGDPFTPIRSTAVYCSPACRQAAYRARSDANET